MGYAHYVHILWRRISPFCTLADVQVSHMEQWEGAWEETNSLRLISLITTLRPSRYGCIVPDAPHVICHELPVLVTFTTAAALDLVDSLDSLFQYHSISV